MFIASFLCDRPGKAVAGNANIWLKVIYIQEKHVEDQKQMKQVCSELQVENFISQGHGGIKMCISSIPKTAQHSQRKQMEEGNADNLHANKNRSMNIYML